MRLTSIKHILSFDTKYCTSAADYAMVEDVLGTAFYLGQQLCVA